MTRGKSFAAMAAVVLAAMTVAAANEPNEEDLFGSFQRMVCRKAGSSGPGAM